jgi:hypothetical protein
MALTDEEADSAFRFLSTALRDAGFAWVTNQVQEKLAFGKVHAKKIPARELHEPTVSFEFLDQPSRATTSKSTSAMFAVSERFSPQERLGVLLDGIDLAIPAVGEVAADAFLKLREFGIDSAVDFAPEAEIDGGFNLDITVVRQRMTANTHLRALIYELRRELENAS